MLRHRYSTGRDHDYLPVIYYLSLASAYRLRPHEGAALQLTCTGRTEISQDAIHFFLRESFIVVIVDLHHRRSPARRQTFHGSEGEETVCRGAARCNPEFCLHPVDQCIRSDERAHQRLAYLDMKLAHLF